MRLPLSDRTSFELFAGGNVATPGLVPRTRDMSTRPIGATTYDRLNFDDAYHHDYTAGAEFDYNFDSHVSAFARAAYRSSTVRTARSARTTSDGRRARVPDRRAVSATPIRAQLDVGARYTFLTGDKWRPFVGAALGAERVSDTYAMVSNTRVALGKADTVFQQRVETGLQYSPMRNFDLRLTAAANHVNGGDASNDPESRLVRARQRAHRRAGALGISRRARRRLALLTMGSDPVSRKRGLTPLRLEADARVAAVAERLGVAARRSGTAAPTPRARPRGRCR